MVARSQQAKAASTKQGKALCTKQAKACSTGKKAAGIYSITVFQKKLTLILFGEIIICVENRLNQVLRGMTARIDSFTVLPKKS